MSSFNQLADLKMTLNACDMKYSKPNVYGKSTWYGIFDGTLAQPFDYFSGIEGVFFVAAMQQLLPILMVSCNRTINVLRPSMESGPGAIGYGGDTAGTEVPLMTAWPASVLQGSKGEKNDVALPGDTKNPWFTVLVPYWDGVTLRTSDIITDDIGGRYRISSAELTDLGWRLTAQQVRP
ncbi:TPA: hypothetical protein ACQ431_003005 [Citrobacter murliniae]